jgi:glycosyltransferase involved in cell wall biosynthesis
MNTPAHPAAPRTVAVVFSRLGPYHLARLQGAAEVLAREGLTLAAIAIAGSDGVYAWDRVDDRKVCPTANLFPQKNYEAIGERELSERLHACLDEFNPLAVALPGWAFSESQHGLAWCRQRQRPAILMSESSREDHVRLWPRELLKQNRVRQFSSALVGGVRHVAYARQLGIPRAAIFTGYDAVDNAYFARGSDWIRREAAPTRQARRLPARYFLTSSRFIAKKNIEGLLRAYALYVARTPAGRDLVVCGDGPERDRLHGLARELGLEKRLHWPGFVQYPELPLYYGLADAFILASTTEPWGLVVNEAMACGLPVLVSDHCGCAPDLVHAGENGFTFDPRNTEDIAGALAKVPDDPAALARLGAASRRIIAGFGPQAFGTGLLDAVRLAVARSGRDDLLFAGGAA